MAASRHLTENEPFSAFDSLVRSDSGIIVWLGITLRESSGPKGRKLKKSYERAHHFVEENEVFLS